MAAHCRGKQMLRKSLDDESKRKLKKRKSTKELAKWWISVGLDPDGFKLIYISDYIGYGVFTTKEFSKSDFLLQYKGIRITNEEAKEAEKKHSKYNMGCFMFYFTFHDKKYCIDATESHGFLGHMVNDGRGMLQNCHMQLVVVNSVPYLCLFALRDIKNGEQLLYDYGDNTVHWLTKKYKVNEDVISCSDVTSDLFEPSAESESESLSSELSFIPAPRKRKYTADVGFGNRKLEYIKKTKKTVDLNDLTFTGLLKKKTKDHENDIVPDSCPSSECAPSHHVIEIGVPPVEGNDGASTEDNTEEVADELNHDTLHELRGEAEDAACINDKTEQAVNELNLDPLHELRERTEDAVCINDKTEEAANELNLDPLHESFEDKLNETYVKEKKTETDVEDELKLASDSVQINIEENDACSTQVEEKNSKTTVDISTNKMSLKRPCSYCMKMFCGRKLKRHIFRKHKDNPEVKFIMKKSKAEQLRFFSEKRSDAIYKHNIKIMHETAGNQDSRNLLRERRPKYLDMLRMCAGCNKFISNKCFYKHKITCSSNTPDAINTYTLGKKNIHQDKEFEDILSRFTENEAGILCKENSVIQQVGYRHFCLRRAEVSKTDEIRKSVMSEMRELARLFIKFKELSDTSVTVEDMFTRAHLKTLREAIDNLASREDGSGKEKYGLKLNINSIIKRSIKSLKGFYSEKLDDDKKKELMHFKDAYDFRAPEIFSNARYQCISNSMNKARRPAELPVESEVQKLGQFINEQIPIAQRNKNYRWLRSLLVSKLTLYNARRGDEPSRMLVQEFEDALNGTWLPDFAMQEVKDEGEKYLVNQFHLAYILGKGKKSYVPILIPKDIIQAISFLKDNRHLYDIPDENPFIFATKSKMSHCSGWHAVKGVCRQASVNVNATENRHRISTFFSGLHMSDKDKEVFYEHMGHAEAINKDNYQCPLGIKEVTVMGKFLNGLENGEINGIHHVTDFSTEETQSASGENQREKGTTSQTTSRMQLEASVSNGIPMKKPSNAVPTDKPIQANVSSVPIIEPDKEVPADKPIQVSWTSADNILLRKYFSDFFAENATSHNNKGCLPKKRTIIEFLTQNKLECLVDFTLQESYVKVRTKLFNERKKNRQYVCQRIINMQTIE